MAPRTRNTVKSNTTAPTSADHTGLKYHAEMTYLAGRIIEVTRGAVLCVDGEYTERLATRQVTRPRVIGFVPGGARLFDDPKVRAILSIPRFNAMDRMINHLLRGVGVGTAIIGRPQSVERLVAWMTKVLKPDEPVVDVDIDGLTKMLAQATNDQIAESGIDIASLPTKADLEEQAKARRNTEPVVVGDDELPF